jgi:hypothetical protein
VETKETRYARVTRSKMDTDPREAVGNYLPANYRVLDVLAHDVLIAGEDNCGWTLDDYVLPRLASGLRFGEEVTVEQVGKLMQDDVALVGV